LLTKDPEQFREGTSFDDLWDIYRFDRTLRRLVLDGAKRVEISVRSHWAYTLSHRYGCMAYEKPDCFNNSTLHQDTLNKIDKGLSSSQEDFVKHFLDKYGMTRPPIWAVIEVLSLGQVSMLYRMLRDPSDRQSIANIYALDEKVLTSFLHHLTTVRNYAAHHSRIWNRRFTVDFQVPRKKPKFLAASIPIDTAASQHGKKPKIYPTLTMLVYLMSIIEPKSHWPGMLLKHITRREGNYIHDMGFPPAWRTLPVWQKLLTEFSEYDNASGQI
jgi:abortive infection bacteriophage resistance protein